MPRRLFIAVLAAAALPAAAPAAAPAKEIQHARACGAAGCVRTGAVPIDALALVPPGQDVPPLAPFYRITLAMGDGQQVLQRYKVLWAPRLHLIAYDEPNPRWFPASPAAERVARRITRGVQPYPAAQMPLHLPPPTVAEVIGPVARPDDDGGGGGMTPLAPLAAVPVAVAAALALRYRSRRAKPRTATTPTSAT